MVPVAAQESLMIASPTNGYVAHPGQALSVTVKAPVGSKYQMVAIIASGSLRWSANTPDILSGPYHMTAIGTKPSGEVEYSAPVTIAVERLSRLVRVNVKPESLSFPFIGSQIGLQVEGVFVDGSTADVTSSKNVTYKSLAPEVATVNPTGLVKAISSGTTQIVVTASSPFQ